MTVVLGMLIYLAIGGLLSGLFQHLGLDDFAWHLAWPVVIIVYLMVALTWPFQKLGEFVNDIFRCTWRKNK